MQPERAWFASRGDGVGTLYRGIANSFDIKEVHQRSSPRLPPPNSKQTRDNSPQCFQSGAERLLLTLFQTNGQDGRNTTSGLPSFSWAISPVACPLSEALPFRVG
jgi:hypothetical protein